MGGCASKPKDAHLNKKEAPPTEVPATPKNSDLVHGISQGNDNGGESKEPAPLVDLSEPKQEAVGEGDSSSSAPKAAEAQEPVSSQVAADLTAELTVQDLKLEPTAKESEENTQANSADTTNDNAAPAPAPASQDKTGAQPVTV